MTYVPIDTFKTALTALAASGMCYLRKRLIIICIGFASSLNANIIILSWDGRMPFIHVR